MRRPDDMPGQVVAGHRDVAGMGLWAASRGDVYYAHGRGAAGPVGEGIRLCLAGDRP